MLWKMKKGWMSLYPVGSESSFLFNLVNQDEDRILHFFLKNSKDLISRINRKGIFQYVSPSIKSLLGYSEQEVQNKSFFTLCHPEDKSHALTQFQLNSIDEKELIRFRMRRRDGHYIWLETSCSSVCNGDEFLCISRDITNQISLEEELAEISERYRLLFENSKDTIGIIDKDGVWICVNPEGSQLFGCSNSDDLLGTTLFDYLTTVDQAQLSSFLQMEDNINFEMNLLRTDGHSKKTDIQLTPMNSKDKKTFQIIIRDITGQKETEEQLQNAEKLSIVGQLAAGIAHEIRNPLTAIKGFAQFLNEGRSNKYADVILNELIRIEGIVNDLLILAKPQPKKAKKEDLLNIIRSVVVLMNSQAALSDISIKEVHLSPKLPIFCEVDKIKQLLINLIKNSIEAMPDGGTITLNTKQNHNFLELSILDEGIGIPKDHLTKLGEPFFSTKEKGTGLGMMICQNIIKNHGGTLQINSKENEGTTVSIVLPIDKNNEQ